MFLLHLNKIVYKLLAVVWTGVILYLTLSSHTPGSNWMANIPHFDKMAHFGIFFIWSGLLYLGFQKEQLVSHLIFIFGCGVLLAILTEWGQSLLPNRQADFLDLIADALGLIIGIISTKTLKNRE